MHELAVKLALELAEEKLADAVNVCRQVPETLGPVLRSEIELGLSLASGALDAAVLDLIGKVSASIKYLKSHRFARAEHLQLFGAIADLLYALEDVVAACERASYPLHSEQRLTEQSVISLSSQLQVNLNVIDSVVDDIAKEKNSAPEYSIQNELIDYVTQSIAHSSTFIRALSQGKAVDAPAIGRMIESLSRTTEDFSETVRPDYAKVTHGLRRAARSLSAGATQISSLIDQSHSDEGEKHAKVSAPSNTESQLVDSALEQLMRKKIRAADPDWMDVRTASSRFAIEIQPSDALKIFLSETLGPKRSLELEDKWRNLERLASGDMVLVMKCALALQGHTEYSSRIVLQLIKAYRAHQNPNSLLDALFVSADWIGKINKGTIPLADPFVARSLALLSFFPSKSWMVPVVVWLEESSRTLALAHADEFFRAVVVATATSTLSDGSTVSHSRAIERLGRVSPMHTDQPSKRQLDRIVRTLLGEASTVNTGRLLPLLKTVEYTFSQRASFEDATFEHIAPRHFSAQYLFDDGPVLRELGSFASMLGNCTLLEREIQERGITKDFQIKKKSYKRSRFWITRALADYNGWDPSAILDRTERLALDAFQSWDLHHDYSQHLSVRIRQLRRQAL